MDRFARRAGRSALPELPEELRILLLEDDPADAELIGLALRRAGIGHRLERQETKADFVAALRRWRPDLLLIDYNLPTLDGMEALAIARDLRPEAPFIFVSGTIGEELAIETLKKGATDYVLKSHLARLGQVVKRALREAQALAQRRDAEEALRRSEALLAQTERLARIGSIEVDIARGTVRRSEEVYRTFGATRRQIGESLEGFYALVHPEDRERVQAAIQGAITQGVPYREEFRIVRPDGRERIVHAEGEVAADEAGRPARLLGWNQDITERWELEQKVLRISDRERRRIGDDLHDDIGQQLTGIALLGRALQARLGPLAPQEAATVADLLGQVDVALAHVRQLAHGLQSVPARPEGLCECLTGLAESVRSTAGIACRFLARGPVPVREPEVANHLFRIAQESVHNALHHGRPGRITIALARARGGVVLKVADDGSGMPEAACAHGGMGLEIMRHRANLIHASLAIASSPGRGTTVTCRVPAYGAAPRRAPAPAA